MKKAKTKKALKSEWDEGKDEGSFAIKQCPKCLTFNNADERKCGKCELDFESEGRAYVKKHYTEMLLKAIDETKEGETFLGRFINMVVMEVIEGAQR